MIIDRGTDEVEIFRALGGRRPLTQIRSMAWTGDTGTVVPLVSAYGLPATDLAEP